MSLEAWYTLGVIAVLVAALASNRIGVDTCMIGALTLLLIGRVVSPAEAAAGFANPSVLMIAALFVVATGLSETGAIDVVTGRLLGRPQNLVGAQLRLMWPVALLSSFMNNTPIVAMYLPVVSGWAKKLRLSPSKLFMPLSFAAILGGACTLIGTSSNLAVNALYIEHFDQHAAELSAQFGLERPSTFKQFWWVGIVGIPAAIIGVALILITSPWLLPERKPVASIEGGGKKYTVETIVPPGSPLVGKSIEEAGLRSLPGLFLSEIEREGRVYPAVSPRERLAGEDRLVFVGALESVVDLLKMRGLSPATDQVNKVEADWRQRIVVEAVVSHTSPLTRKTVRQSQFRTRYNAAIIAVHRGRERVEGKIGDIVLQPGDTLLLSTNHSFLETYRDSAHFYLVSDVEGTRVVRHERAWLALSIMGLLVALLAIPLPMVISGINALLGTSIPDYTFEPLTVGFLCAMLMVITRCCTGTIARRSINLQVLIVIAAAIGIGKAMGKTGLAKHVADAMFEVVGGLGNHGVLLVFAILTTLVCQLITNKGAAVLMFPIAMAMADDLGVNPEPFVVTLMAVTACSFLTPVGFVTNLMVYGPGGYRFWDFARLGTPLTLMVWLLSTILAPLAFPFAP